MRQLKIFSFQLLGSLALAAMLVNCSPKDTNQADATSSEGTAEQANTTGNSGIPEQAITVDGKLQDWESVPGITVNSQDKLWIGEGLPEGAWQGEQDLNFSFKMAHQNGKLFFLFQVKDDTLSTFDQQFSWMNDCIEIYVDPQNQGGDRIEGIGPDNTLEDRLGRKINGYEMHFLPSQPTMAFVDDTKGVYYTDSAQTKTFQEQWQGQAVTRRTEDGYIMEIGFAVPNAQLSSGKTVGIDVGICDDDGQGRKSLLLWSGYKGQFWLTMDNFKDLELK